MRFIFEKSAWAPDWSFLINPGREAPESGGGDFFVAGPEHEQNLTFRVFCGTVGWRSRSCSRPNGKLQQYLFIAV
jgi:hypothetical protein